MPAHLAYSSLAECRPIGSQSKSLRLPPILDGWRLSSILGRGATTTVYAASPVEQPGNVDADYALKILHDGLHEDAAARRRLCFEATALSGHHHPNLMTVLSASLKQAPYYLVLPRLRGATLARTLQHAGRCCPPRALWIARQLAEALAALHAKGWVHLDLKPANVVLDPSGHCTLIDLDLSLPLGAQHVRSPEIRGSLAYTAPETFTCSTNCHIGSDVYSLGIVLFEMLCGKLPFSFSGDRPAEYVEAHLRQVPPSVRTHCPELPCEVSRLVSRMLAKQPDRRPATDGELQDELARLEIACFGMRGFEMQAAVGDDE